MTGPKSSAGYFALIDEFVARTLGPEAQKHYRIEIGDPVAVARAAASDVNAVKNARRQIRDAFYFNWQLNIEHDFQQPFEPTHEKMAGLNLSMDQEKYSLAANLRRAFSGVVAGNVKDEGIRAIEEHGPFQIHGEAEFMALLDKLLTDFIAQGRMRLEGEKYRPSYQIVT